MKLKVEDQLRKCKRFIQNRIYPYVDKKLLDCHTECFVNPSEPDSAVDFIKKSESGRIKYSPANIGSRWGTTWGTTWFRICGRLPEVFINKKNDKRNIELLVDLGWIDGHVGGQAEGLIYSDDGSPLKGIHPKNNWIRILGDGAAQNIINDDGSFRLYLEAANNPQLVNLKSRSTSLGDGTTGKHELPYIFNGVSVCIFNEELWDYMLDLEVVSDLILQSDSSKVRYWRLVRALQRSLNKYDDDDIAGTLKSARDELHNVLSSPANESTLCENAVGHAHIDSAYLWPTRETKRKIARTVSNVLALMDQNEDFVYAMSSAQQYEWLENEYPSLFKRLHERVIEGRFIPVGGMWVEPDTMMPCGESLVRQIIEGQEYFQTKFGVRARGIWLPDSFGYTGSLPQIARRAGYRWFLTQKISWNDTTTFPHNSFMWEGIDGTEIFTHFPPTNTYAAEITPKELCYGEANFRDKEIADQALILYGYGDGGGGPTREMLGRINRMNNLEGVSHCYHSTPDGFFENALLQLSRLSKFEIPRWKGELYLERHRATLTSQQDMKFFCRKEECLLRIFDYLSTYASLVSKSYIFPKDDIKKIWHALLLNQFHDILPGSAISWVYREATKEFKSDCAQLLKYIKNACTVIKLSIPGTQVISVGSIDQSTWVARSLNERICGSSKISNVGSNYILDNGRLRVQIDTRNGSVLSLYDVENDRELVSEGEKLGNLILLKDKPSERDAWEIDRDAFLDPKNACHDYSVKPFCHEDSSGVEISANLGKMSRANSTISLRCGEKILRFEHTIAWNEKDRFLKIEVPIRVETTEASYECQYGFVKRPIAKNSDTDEAKFESCSQRFVHVNEANYGIAVINSSIYGSSAFQLPPRESGGRSRGILLGLSLLSSATYPDPHADVGRKHHFEWAFCPDFSISKTVSFASEFNSPVLRDLPKVDPLVSLEKTDGDVVIDWIKLAEDGSGDVVVRLYEPCGGKAKATIRVAPFLSSASIWETDLLEDNELTKILPRALVSRVDYTRCKERYYCEADGAQLIFAPFQIATLRISNKKALQKNSSR